MFGQDFFEGGNDQEQQSCQLRRQVKLAVGLAEKLDRIRADSSGKILKEAKSEAQGILTNDVSLARFITEIAFVYTNRAEWYLASFTSALGSWSMGAVSSRAHSRGREASQQAHTAKLAVRSFWKLRRIVQEADENEKNEKNEKNESESQVTNDQDGAAAEANSAGATATASAAGASLQEELPAALSSALPTFMETFWSLSSHDITGTLNKVIERVLRDSSVDVDARCDRARALRELGHALQETAEKAKAMGAPAAAGRECQRFEKAFMASVARD